MIRHQDIDRRSLAFGQAAAAKITADPSQVDRARQTLERWLKTCSPRAVSTLNEWQAILNQPLDCIVKVLTSTDERAIRLRQSNPFAGILTNSERNAIILEFHDHDA